MHYCSLLTSIFGEFQMHMGAASETLAAIFAGAVCLLFIDVETLSIVSTPVCREVVLSEGYQKGLLASQIDAFHPDAEVTPGAVDGIKGDAVVDCRVVAE